MDTAKTRTFSLAQEAMAAARIGTLAAAILFSCTGCSAVRVSRKTPGHVTTVWSIRLLWQTQEVDLKAKAPDGVQVDLKLFGSQSDSNSVKAAAEGAAKGAIQGF